MGFSIASLAQIRHSGTLDSSMKRRHFLTLASGNLVFASCFGGSPRTGALTYGDFDGVLIEPIATRFGSPDASAAVIEQLALQFRNGLRTAFGRQLKLIGTPGPRTLRVRALVSDGNPSGVLIHHANPEGRMQGAVGPALGTIAISSLSGEAFDAKGRRIAAIGAKALSSIPNLDPSTDWLVIRTFCETTAESLASKIPATPPVPSP